MQMKKRVLSVLLALCLSLSLAGAAFAENETSGAPSSTVSASTTTTEVTETPAPTEEPEDIETPVPTEDPEDTETPAPTEDPEDTEAPAPGEEPEDTETPASTEEPEDTETPVPVDEQESEPTQDEEDVQDDVGAFRSYAPLRAATVTIEDQIKSTGRLVATVAGADSDSLTYTWYRKADNGSFEAVTPVKVSGDDYNTQDNWLNVALDIESLCAQITDSSAKNTIRSRQYTYRVEIKQNDEVVGSAEYQVPYYAQLLNGSFEQSSPIVWKTTASDGAIEIGRYNQDIYVYGTEDDKPSNDAGEKFAELNANAAGALYQDVLTVPGADLTWELAHRARNAQSINSSSNYIMSAKDTMYVVIMSTQDAEALLDGVDQSQQQNVLTTMINAVLDNQESVRYATYTLQSGSQIGKQVTVTVTKVSTTSKLDREWNWFYYTYTYTSTGQWKTYRGDYVVPKGQYATRFFFAAGDTATKNPTVGNLIDEVWFSPELPPPNPDKANLTISKTVEGISSSEVPAGTFTFSVTKDGSEVASFALPTEDGSWKYSLTNTDPGTYTITETTPAADLKGYSYTGTTVNGQKGLIKKITLNANANETVTFLNSYSAPGNNLTITKTFENADGETIAPPDNLDHIDVTVKQTWNGTTVSETTVRLTKNGSFTGTMENAYYYTDIEVTSETMYDANGQEIDDTDWSNTFTVDRHYDDVDMSLVHQTATEGNQFELSGTGMLLIKRTEGQDPVIVMLNPPADETERQRIAEEAASNVQGGIKAADIVWMTPEELKAREGVSIDFQADGTVDLDFGASSKWAQFWYGTFELTNVDISGALTNTLNTKQTTDITVTKIWDDDNNPERPDSVAIQVKNGRTIVGNTVTLSAANATVVDPNTWSKTVQVPKYNADGTLAVYTIVETVPDGYVASYSDDGLTVTNSLATGDLKITKRVIWSDDENPGSATGTTFTFTITGPADMAGDYTIQGSDEKASFTLDEDGTTATATVTITGANSIVIEDLPQETYTINETIAPDIGNEYYCSGTEYSNSNNTVTVAAGQTPVEKVVTNTYTHYKTLVITKQVDQGSSDAIGMGEKTRKFHFTTSLTRGDVSYAVEANAETPFGIELTTDAGTAEWQNAGTDSWTESGYGLANNGSITLRKVKVGDIITFVETEQNEDGYSTSYTIETNNTVSANGENGDFILTVEDGCIAIGDTKIAVEDDQIDVTVTNNRPIVAPTGLESNHTTPYTLMVTAAGIAGLALIGGIVTARRRRRRME